MSLEQYNSLMSNLLNQKYTLAKLRAELEERRERICQCCKGFGHLAQNYRSRDEKEERCYESPKQEKVSYTFEHLIQNLKAYNGVRI